MRQMVPDAETVFRDLTIILSPATFTGYGGLSLIPFLHEKKFTVAKVRFFFVFTKFFYIKSKKYPRNHLLVTGDRGE